MTDQGLNKLADDLSDVAEQLAGFEEGRDRVTIDDLEEWSKLFDTAAQTLRQQAQTVHDAEAMTRHHLIEGGTLCSCGAGPYCVIRQLQDELEAERQKVAELEAKCAAYFDSWVKLRGTEQ